MPRRHCRERGTKEFVGETSVQNFCLLNLARKFDFECTPLPDKDMVALCRDLSGNSNPEQQTGLQAGTRR
jgi:hypothetical protein